MVKFLENKVIYNNFEKMFYEHYENESKYRNVYIVDIFPKKIDSSKYFDFEDYIINNKYKKFASLMSPTTSSVAQNLFYAQNQLIDITYIQKLSTFFLIL